VDSDFRLHSVSISRQKQCSVKV